jgi:hypothetical protein
LNNLTPYQEVELLYNNVNNSDSADFGNTDKYNNTYDSFNVTLSDGLGLDSESFKFSQKYRVKLNRISFPSITEVDMGDYNTSDEIFDLYCNESAQYFNTSDQDLKDLSDNLTSGITNPVEKARRIFNWVSNNIAYKIGLNEEKGASWAYDNKQGDCSEYSDLMITLLRIQGIPARKVTGIVVSYTIPWFPLVGDEYTFNYAYTPIEGKRSNLMAHAWVEYFVPNYGWIECDPTWHSPPFNSYFNTIDYLRFRFNVGEWFKNATGGDVSEYPILPGYYSSTDNYNYEFKATILETDYLIYYILYLMFYYPSLFESSGAEDQDLGIYLYVGTGAMIATALLSTVVVFVNKKRKGLI